MEPKILHLTLKKKWFDMILSGEKKEEYREIKTYWVSRLCASKDKGYFDPKIFEYVKFKNGYGKNAPSITLEFEGIKLGKAKPEWSDNWKGDVFIIKLGSRIQ